jgi:Protein of unknown function (DUF664)
MAIILSCTAVSGQRYLRPMTRELQQPSADQRTDPPYVAGERQSLEAWLDFHRSTLLWKCEGLSPDQLVQRSAEPSTMSLLGLVRHMAEVERGWFRQYVAGEDVPDLYCTEESPDGDFDEVDPARAADDFATFRSEVEVCRAVGARYDLDHTTRRGRRNFDIDVRWVYIHMIEEYARHNGHADLLRERIDGVIGD